MCDMYIYVYDKVYDVIICLSRDTFLLGYINCHKFARYFGKFFDIDALSKNLCHGSVFICMKIIFRGTRM